MAIIGGEATSPFVPNQLFDVASGQALQRGRMNDLMLQSKQQDIGATDQEMVARASAYIDGLPADQKPTAYASAVRDLQSRGFAMKAPAEYPGDEVIKQLATMGTPSKDTLAIGASQAAKSALYPGQGASAAPAGGGGSDPIAGLPVEQALDAIRQRESGGRNVNTEIAGADGKPASSASGYYQIIDSTWQDGAKLAGVDVAKYPRAIDAPEDVQRSVARAIYQRDGATPWAASAPGRGVAGRIPGAFDVAGQAAAPSPAAAPALLPNGLKPEQDRQMQVLRTTRGVTSEELLAAQERFRASNRIEAADARVAAHQAAEDARQAANDKAIADERARKAAQEGVPPGYRMVDGKAERIPGLPQDETVAKQDNQRFQQENALRDEFGKLTADFRVVQTSYENIRSAARAKDGASDMSLLYSYVKLLDPTSVVRESEFGAAAASGSFGERVKGAAERILSGARMPESLRDSFVREAGNLYNNQLQSHNDIAGKYEALAKSNGLDPAKVVTRFARPQDNPETGAISVKTAEDYAKVPPGADYTDPDGHVRRKPK